MGEKLERSEVLQPQMSPIKKMWGIDFGSKKRETTWIVESTNSDFKFYQSQKGKDTDRWLEELVLEKSPQLIFIDAPLSLPLVYSKGHFEGADYHYRKADRNLHAMSPLFLGGLTARAMSFAARAKQKGSLVFETYPKAVFTKRFERCSDKKEALTSLETQFSIQLPNNPHAHDAFFAWYAAFNYAQGGALRVGLEEEGVIYL